MAIRITLECGHSSVVRMRTTPQGYTHDWEVFVRGIDNAEIHHYVEKVVFQLHQTFSRPRRILKEPPFVIKESGYAGFEIPIHIYLKNKDEGSKKIEILYDLNLQSSGPAITNVIRHTEIINNPSDEFKRKLLKGGGVLVSSSENSTEKSEPKALTMVGKPKMGGNESKKHKNIELKTTNSFAELFGTPLKATKVSQDTRKVTLQEKSSASKSLFTSEKSDKGDKTKLKDNSHKDIKKEKVDDKKDKKVKDQPPDKNRIKERVKRPLSPASRSHSAPSNKRPSPTGLVKRPSPLLPPLKRSSSPKSKEREPKKLCVEKEKDKNKEKDKVKDNSKIIDSKNDKRKDKKGYKDDRDKERKDKYKEGERSGSKEAVKLPEKKNNKSDKSEKSEKSEKEKSQEYKSAKDGRKSPKLPKEGEKSKDDKLGKMEKSEKTDKSEKTKDSKSEKDRQKHKHKKRDRKDKRDSSKDRDKKERRDRVKSSTEKQNNVPNVSVANPLSTLLAEMPERDSSDSAPSIDDDSLSDTKLVPIVKKDVENLTVSTSPREMAKPVSPSTSVDVKKEKVDRNKREKPKGKGDEKEIRKKKRRSDSKGDDEPVVKKDRGHSSSSPLEPVSSSQSPVVVDQETAHKDKEGRAEQAAEKRVEAEAEQVAPDSTNSTLVESDMAEPPVFSEDYVSQLKDLQQKIMTLQDNQELQRVVQVIAETGQYEITKKTFDFDLCALDRRTVQRLQQFFAS